MLLHRPCSQYLVETGPVLGVNATKWPCLRLPLVTYSQLNVHVCANHPRSPQERRSRCLPVWPSRGGTQNFHSIRIEQQSEGYFVHLLFGETAAKPAGLQAGLCVKNDDMAEWFKTWVSESA